MMCFLDSSFDFFFSVFYKNWMTIQKQLVLYKESEIWEKKGLWLMQVRNI